MDSDADVVRNGRLPAASLVAFELRRALGAYVAHFGDDKSVPESELLERCAWIDPLSIRTATLGSQRRVFFGERYGGAGIGRNGGGVRCGNDGSIQIKGIGINPLMGREAPSDYSHGGLSLCECIQEHLWGEILDFALPFGAVRSVAVIGIDEDCWWVIDRWGVEALSERYGTPPRIPRGLLVRETSIRPAHFERASMYRPSIDSRNEVVRDVERVRVALTALNLFLPGSEGGIAAHAGADMYYEEVGSGVCEMARRYAMQSVAAKSKRLVHGNITSSNITLDGRWIDFGSATAIPNWGRACGYGPFWDDTELYGSIVGELVGGLGRLPGADKARLADITDIAARTYRSTHDQWLIMRFASLSGIPWVLFDDVEAHRAARRFSSVVIRIAKIGGDGYLSPHPDNHDAFGRYRIAELLESVAHAESTERQYALIDDHFSDRSLSCQLYLAYRELVGACIQAAQRRGIASDSLLTLMRLSTSKRKHVPEIMFRERMVRETERIVASADSVGELRVATRRLCDQTIEAARISLDDADSLKVEIVDKDGAHYSYDAISDAFTARDGTCYQSDDQIKEIFSERWGGVDE